jgi:hypothetical protein
MEDVDDEESDEGDEDEENDANNCDLHFRFFSQKTRDHGGGLGGIEDHLLPDLLPQRRNRSRSGSDLP